MAALLCLIFFASGASALIFETLWFRQAGLAFGNSIWASSLVLSGFMGGLAVGNAFAARYGGHFKNPIHVYAIAEVAIALTGVGLVYLLPVFGVALTPWFRPLLDHPWILNPLRFLMAFLLLLIPSTAMGVTLPFFTKALKAYDFNFGSRLGRLYGWNAMGAMTGVVVGEGYLIGAYGVRGTALTAAALNLLAAIISAQLSTRAEFRKKSAIRQTEKHSIKTREGIIWLTAGFLSGFCLLALEVVWFRFLLLFVKGHSMAFSTMLAVVLAGIAVGGLVASKWLRLSPEAYRFASPIAFSSGLLCILSYAAFPLMINPLASYQISDALDILRIGAPLMFPVSMLSGIFFTFAGVALRNSLSSETKTAGGLALANTTGAALGSLVSGFLLLPILGIERSVFLIAILYAGVGTILFLKSITHRRIAQATALLFLLSVVFFPFGSMKEDFLQIPVKRHLQGADGRIIAVREGLSETIVYIEKLFLGRPVFYMLLTNSFSMSRTSYAARRYMKLFVYWPMAVHPNIKHALLIGYGIGNTAKAATDSKSLETIDIVEISREHMDMNNIVYPDNAEQPLKDKRVRVHVEDGRYFLQTTERRFDLITGEPPPTGLAGVVNLYTREYFQLLFDRLAEGGIVTYRMPLRELTDVSTKAVLRAFCDVFKDCSLWNGMSDVLMMAGTRNALGPVREDQFTRQWNDPAVAQEMKRLGFERPEQLGALFIGDAEYLKTVIDNSPPLIDNYPKLIEAPFSSQEAGNLLLRNITDEDAAKVRFSLSPLIKHFWPERLLTESLLYFEFQDIINNHFYGTKMKQTSTMENIHVLLTRSSLNTPILWHLGSDSDIQEIVEKTMPGKLTQPYIGLHLGIRQISERNYAAAIDLLQHAELLPETQRYASLLRTYALCMRGLDQSRCLQF